MRLTPADARRIATAVVLPFGLLVLPGCAASGAEETPGTPAAELDSISAEIEEQLRQMDGVAAVDVYYQDSITVPESAAVEITIEPGADPHALDDEALRLVWESRLDPLRTIHVSVIDPVTPMDGVAGAVTLLEDDQGERLEKKYGPHPD